MKQIQNDTIQQQHETNVGFLWFSYRVPGPLRRVFASKRGMMRWSRVSNGDRRRVAGAWQQAMVDGLPRDFT
jgi:hypothetical protein